MIYTVGHSTLSEDTFASEIICGLDVLMDIRSHPNSRHEQFKIENLRKWIPKKTLATYEWEPGLGGWDIRHLKHAKEMSKHGVDLNVYSKGKFPKQRINLEKEKEGHPTWYNQGFYDYSWFMTLKEFHDAADRLIERSEKENIGIMCCEVLWWACHRSMVADYLYYKGVESVHLQPKQTTHSRVISNRIERYDKEILETWGEAKYKNQISLFP